MTFKKKLQHKMARRESQPKKKKTMKECKMELKANNTK